MTPHFVSSYSQGRRMVKKWEGALGIEYQLITQRYQLSEQAELSEQGTT